MLEPVSPQPWIELRKDILTEDQCRPWILPAVYEQARSGARGYLSEFRTAAALFLSFTGIDYDHDQAAGQKLDQFTRWVQTVVAQYDGSVLQLTMGDKGSYLYAVFGAPIAHNDDAIRAVYAALALQDVPAEFNWIKDVKIGVTQGQMRTGTYGGSSRRTYGAQGDKVNLAARLMQAAEYGVVCDRAIYLATQARLGFEQLVPVTVKGVQDPVEIFRPTGEKIRLERKHVPMVGRLSEQIQIGRFLQTTKHGPGKVLILDLKTLMIAGEINVGNGPENLIRWDDRVYVANSGGWTVDNKIHVIDIDSDFVIDSVVVGDNPTDLVADLNGDIWVLCKGKVEYDQYWNIVDETNSEIYVIDSEDLSIKKSFAIGQTGDFFNPARLACSHDGTNIYYLESDGIYKMGIGDSGPPVSPIINRSFYGLDVDQKNGTIFCRLCSPPL